VLDGILGNQTDLPVTEHATDTHGATLANFALFDLLGLQLSPRIRDPGKITLYWMGPRADFTSRYPSAGKLLTRRFNNELITGMWDDLLRVAAFVKGGHATAALVVGKLCFSRRQQNALAAAIKEYGALRRTVYAARYLADEIYRRKVAPPRPCRTRQNVAMATRVVLKRQIMDLIACRIFTHKFKKCF
jgi:TnpA family transposase